MVKAILQDGVIEPLSPLPSSWTEGKVLVVQEAPSREASDPNDWSEEVEELAREIPDEDFDRLEAALAEADDLAKAQVRLQMGIR